MLGTLFGTSMVCLMGYRYFSGLQAVSNWPGVRSLFTPFSIFGALLPASWWNPGLDYAWTGKLHLYKRSYVTSAIGFLFGPPILLTSSIEVMDQVVGHNSSFDKDPTKNALKRLWGASLLSESGDNWKRHRRIVAPAFNTKTYALAWEEAKRCYHNLMVSEGWDKQASVFIPEINGHMSKVTLFVIASCGFGINLRWDDPPLGADGKMSVKESLRLVSKHMLLRLVVPRWAYKLPIKTLQQIDIAYSNLGVFMRSEVAARKADLKEHGGQADVFSRLVAANENEEVRGARLDDDELIGNTFLMLFAGHDTTANTLSATIAFLALYQNEQEKVYNHIRNVFSDGREPDFSDLATLDPVLCAFLEALRFYPAGQRLYRKAMQDTVLKFKDKSGVDAQIPVRKGLTVIMDMVGVCYNPDIYPDPLQYKPSRWDTQAARNAFPAFSTGPRACIGNKFAIAESVSFLTMLLKEWKLDVVLENGETREQWKERIMWAKCETILKIGPVPVKMIRRR